MTLPTPGEILSDSSLMHPTEVLTGDQNDPEGPWRDGAKVEQNRARNPPSSHLDTGHSLRTMKIKLKNGGMTPQAQSTQGKDKVDVVKTELFCCAKDTV